MAAGVKWLKQLEVPRTLLISVDEGYRMSRQPPAVCMTAFRALRQSAQRPAKEREPPPRLDDCEGSTRVVKGGSRDVGYCWVIEMGTIAGAKAAHLDHKIGTLTPGKEADIIMLATDRINVFIPRLAPRTRESSVGPRVRIRLPPAGSLVRTGLSARRADQERRCGR